MLAGCLVSRDAWERFGSLTASFSLPLPAQVLDPAWQLHLQQALKQLTFRRKLRILPAAASSGSEFNLEVAWGLLRPGLFPELLTPPQVHEQRPFYQHTAVVRDAGTTAVQSGHAHLLPWLVQHGCPLDRRSTLAAAVQHCDLAGLQQVWELLGGITRPTDRLQWSPWYKIATAAGRSAAASTAKLSWLLSMAGEGPQGSEEEGYRRRLLAAAAAGAAASGNMTVLQWLQQQGMDLRSEHDESFRWLEGAAPWWAALTAALQQGHVAVADWLVDEAGCPLRQAGEQQQMSDAHTDVWRGAACNGSVEAMRWLLRRGVPVHAEALEAAAVAGGLKAVQFLHRECGLQLTEGVFRAAAGSRSMATATWLLQAGCPMSPDAYRRAALVGDVVMVRWLVQEAGCPLGQDTVLDCVKNWPRDRANSDLEQALRVLVGAGGLLPPPSATPCLDEAAARGDLPLLRYLHEELGWEFGRGTLAAAARGGCAAVLEWLVGAGCVAGESQGEAGEGHGKNDPYVSAGRGGDLATLSCLRHLGVPWGAGAYWGPVRGPVLRSGEVLMPVLRWLVEQGAPWYRRVVEQELCIARKEGIYNDSMAWFEARLAASQPAEG